MKSTTLTLLVIIAAASATEETDTKQDEDTFMEEFMSGFDKGYFWRNEPEKWRETDCPGPMIDKSLLNTHETIMKPLSLVLKLLKSPMVSRSFELTEYFMHEIIYLQGSVGRLYKGPPYCSGVLFGIYGGRLLIGMGNAFTGGSNTAWSINEDGSVNDFAPL